VRGPRARTPSHTTIVAYLALFLALGGVGAYAASKIDSKEIKRGAIRAKHIERNAVRAKQIQDGGVGKAELGDGSVASAELGDGSVLPAKLELTESVERANRVSITGGGSQPLGLSLALDVPPEGFVLFEANAYISRSAGTGGCRILATSGSFSEYLLEPTIDFMNPPQPYESGLVPSHPAPGPHTFALEGSVNGVTTETCHFENIDFHAIVVR
jgi:hypothetical protein